MATPGLISAGSPIQGILLPLPPSLGQSAASGHAWRGDDRWQPVVYLWKARHHGDCPTDGLSNTESFCRHPCLAAAGQFWASHPQCPRYDVPRGTEAWTTTEVCIDGMNLLHFLPPIMAMTQRLATTTTTTSAAGTYNYASAATTEGSDMATRGG